MDETAISQFITTESGLCGCLLTTNLEIHEVNNPFLAAPLQIRCIPQYYPPFTSQPGHLEHLTVTGRFMKSLQLGGVHVSVEHA